MTHEGSNNEFFSAGGTLPPDSASYVKRAADDQLLSLTKRGKFCYVLTASQMGKSSLMIRTSAELRSKGVKTAIIDLNQIGIQGVTVDQWYLSMLSQLQEHLSFTKDPGEWWEFHQDKSYIHRFTSFLRQVILKEIAGEIVIFVDEIGKTLEIGERLGSVEFGDDFFGGIRFVNNARAHEPEFKRLTFVLLGIASPSDLIKNPIHTPFGIASPIALEDFTEQESAVLQEQLEAVFGSKGKIIFKAIYDWTSGHPYLTQKLCLNIVKNKKRQLIDAWVQELFQKTGPKRDDNLSWVEKSILDHRGQYDLLRLYKKIYQGQKIRDNPQSTIHNQLKLSGLVKVDNGYLHLRNNIYKLVFDLEWIKLNSEKKQIEDEDDTSLLEALLILLDSLSRYRVRTAATLTILVVLVFFANPIVPIDIPFNLKKAATVPSQVITLSPTISSSPTSEIVVIETETSTIIPTETATPTIRSTETRTPTITPTETRTPTITPTESATVTETSVPSTEISTVLPITPSQTEVQREDDISSESPKEELLTNTPIPPTVASATQTPVPSPVPSATNTLVPPTIPSATSTALPPTIPSATGTALPPTIPSATGTALPPTIAPTATPMSPTVTAVPSPTTSPTIMSFSEVTREPGLIEAAETPITTESEGTTDDNEGGEPGGSTGPSQPSPKPTKESPPEPTKEPPPEPTKTEP